MMMGGKTHKQVVRDTWDFVKPNRHRMLEKDWPGLFKQHLLSELPVTHIHPVLSGAHDEPGADASALIEDNAVKVFLKELHTLLGALFLQQVLDLNDYDTVRQVAFNFEWHYALNITEANDQATCISEKVLCSWRQTLIEHHLDQLMFDNHSDKLALVFKSCKNGKCTDGERLKSNMRRLGCISLVNQSINRFLVSLKYDQELFKTVSEQLRNRYASQKALAVFSLIKPSESAGIFQQVSADLHDLVGQFKDKHTVHNMQTYKQLKRLCEDQGHVKNKDHAVKGNDKKPKMISRRSLHNASNVDDSEKKRVHASNSEKAAARPSRRRSKNRMKKMIVLAIAFFIVGAVLLSLPDHGKGVQVNVIPVGKGKISSTLNATGKVVSKEECRVSAAVSGRVKSILVAEGGNVAKGEPMAQLDGREQREQIASAEASFHEAQEKVRQKKQDYDALKTILSVGGTSKQSVQDARSSLEIARHEEELASAELKKTKIVLDHLTVTAPFEGTVTNRNVHSGEWVTVGDVLFVLSNQDSREIEIMVDASDGGLVHVGQQIELTSEAIEDQRWQEQVVKISPSISKEGTANFIKVYVSYGNKSPDLKIGQQVDAKIKIANRNDAVKVPFEAIFNDGGKTCVAVVKDDVIRYVPVVTGIEDSISIEILKGVSAGQDIILPKGKPIKEGERVEMISRENS